MKKKLATLAILLGMGSMVYGQGFLGIGTGTSTKAWTMSLSTGYIGKYVDAEFEMKAAPISNAVTEPGVFSFKAGCPIAIKDGVLLIPQLEYAYMLYSNDEFKAVTYQNGWKLGAGMRLQANHLFVQADYLGKPYISAGIIAYFRRRQ